MSYTRSAYRIQFQKGLGLREFQARYGTEAQCRKALYTARYPEGFLCRICGSHKHWVVARPALKCAGCRTETSLTAGTLFHCTKLPLTTWFLGIYLFTQTKTGLSTVELKRHLGVNVKTASLMQHKLMETFHCHERKRRLDGRVRISQGKLPRGTAPPRGNSPARCSRFLLAAEVNEAGGLVHACVDPFPSRGRGILQGWLGRRMSTGARIENSLPRTAGRTESGHFLPDADRVTGGRNPAPAGPDWGRILSGNLCSALEGVRHRSFHRYGARFLGLFQFRLNHRFDLAGIAETAIRLAALSSARPRIVLMGVESDGQSGHARDCHTGSTVGLIPSLPAHPVGQRPGP